MIKFFVALTSLALVSALPRLEEGLQSCLPVPPVPGLLGDNVPDAPIPDAGPGFDKARQFLSAYAAITNPALQHCDEVLIEGEVQITIGNPIKDLCEIAGTGAEIRFCAVTPGAIAAKQTEKARQQEAEDEDRDLEADSAVPFGSLRSALPLPGGGCKELPELNEEDLLSIEPSPLNFRGFCFVCSASPLDAAAPAAAAAAPAAAAAETVGRLGGLLG